MTCRQIVELVEQYLAGEVASEKRRSLELHLASCGNCRRYLRSYQDTARLAAYAAKHPDDAAPSEVPEDLVRTILSTHRRAKR